MNKVKKILCLIVALLVITCAVSVTAFAEPEDDAPSEETQSTEVTPDEPEEEPSQEAPAEQESQAEEQPESQEKNEKPAPSEEVDDDNDNDGNYNQQDNYTGNDYTEDTGNNGGNDMAPITNKRPDSSTVKNSDKYGTMSSEEVSSNAVVEKNIGSNYDRLAKILFYVFIGVAVVCIIGLIVFNVKIRKRNLAAEGISKDNEFKEPKSGKKPAYGKGKDKKKYDTNEFKSPDGNSRKH